MKRTMLMTALLGLVAGVAFAETAPVFSGTFSTYFAYEFSSKEAKDKAKNDVKLDLAATIDEWNTVSVSLTTENALKWTDKGRGGAKKDEKVNNSLKPNSNVFDEISDSDGYLKLGDFTLTTDVLGALGIDAPVSIKTKVGKFGFKTANVADVAAKSVKKVGGNGTAKGVGIGVDVTLFDMVTVSSVFYPKSVVGKKAKTAETGVTVKATGILDMIDVAAYFISSGYDTENVTSSKGKYEPKDSKGMNMGASVAAAPIDGLKFGLGVNYDLSVFSKVDGTKGASTKWEKAPNTYAMQADAAFTMIDRLNVGLSYGLTGIGAKDFKFADKSSAFFSVGYDVFDNLNVSGAVGLNGFSFGKGFAGKIPYDVAVTTSLGGMEVRIGASNQMKDFKAPEKDFNHALYLKFSTSF